MGKELGNGFNINDMGCGSCGTGGCSTKGCNSGGCASGGCNKLNTYDWFGNMLPPTQNETNNIYEIRFKNTRKAFFKNVNGVSLITGDYVVVESDRGFDVGQISLGGILAQLQMKKRRINPRSEKIRKIYRRATSEDLEKLREARSREQETLLRTRDIIRELNLDMKASDVEFQGDNTKAIFYYIADQRVDFRELIKILATEFKIRVEMKQIGLRHESGLVGGIGSCGRELCCSTWLTDFKSVSTSAARYQNLSLNPMKISGQCGRLKCCLNFELEAYLDALKDIPDVERLETEQGIAFLQKTDIFKGTMWFSYKDETTWIPLEVHKVQIMHEMNKRGEKPASLRVLEDVADVPIDFVDVVGQAELRNDPKRKKKKKKKPGDRRDIQNASAEGGQQQVEGGANPQGQPQNRNPRPEGQGGDRRNRDRNNRGPRNERNDRGERGERREPREGQGGQNQNRGGNQQKPRNDRQPREQNEQGGEGNAPDKDGEKGGGNPQNRNNRNNNNRNRGRNDRRGPRNDGDQNRGGDGGSTPPPPPNNPA